MNGELRYLSVRILPLIQPADQQAGKVVLWRDISERRRTDIARQRARDEMFILLRSISDTAFRTLNLNDFLAEAISQIVYSFQSQAGLIFLLEETRSKKDALRVCLAAHHGIPQNMIQHLSPSPEVNRIVTHMMERKEPFIVPDVPMDPRLPHAMRQSGNKSLLMVPLITGEQVLGVIGLVRQSGLAFGRDEMTRLTIVAEELASFIHSDRERQDALALEERQRLFRDLHDSISQKLYGLVALTEAAQAKLETGALVQAADLSWIGENARQALKEMRLFLYPNETGGSGNQGTGGSTDRKAGGRGGAGQHETRVLTDENINLTLEKEIVLYQVALEALNNIIKHANAKSVDILLRKRNDCVILEVADDGSGFDSKATGRGGMGLRIMQERVAKVDGKITIRSAPGKGTKVIATVGENKIPNPTRNKGRK